LTFVLRFFLRLVQTSMHNSNFVDVLASKNCFSNGWDPIGEVLIKHIAALALAVDDDFNIYIRPIEQLGLQKWSPDGSNYTRLFTNKIMSPIFYHLLSRSLYFFYVSQNIPSIYKVIDGDSLPMNVLNASGVGSGLNQLGSSCQGLYVNSVDDIYVLDDTNCRVVKWTVNASSGILVAGGGGCKSDSNQLKSPTILAVDEINSILYIKDGSRTLKFVNGSTNGVIIFRQFPEATWIDIPSEHVNPFSLLVDKMGNILVGDGGGITKWMPDVKSNVIITPQNKQNLPADVWGTIGTAHLMTFDKLENLYVYDGFNSLLLKFSRNHTSCEENLR
jgi:hypothetical protein